MKLVWSPETASKAYIDTVQSCKVLRGSGVAELISAMAAGWNAKVIVETWSEGGVIETSIGLAIARKHTSGRHVCIVPNERSRLEYSDRIGETGASTEIMVGEPDEVMERFVEEIDFMVVDCKGDKDFSRVLKVAKLSVKGAVLVCKNANLRNGNFKWENVVVEEGGLPSRRVVRSVFLPVGKGLDMAHVSAVGGNLGKDGRGRSGKRWIRHVDQRSGEMHVIRR
ncbi:unnamed protein product [Lathyrus oleraceus]|uniref:DUF1442 family protein n=1 Tax=Pisum sativum TaxID=3888 RepID=A0A9D4XBL2_PEA|nr:uncharacterized protein LOC127074111 [Pisum sativum]KAI5417378.1 hypothetical protein KIW84_042109 [Pisum sativum]